MLKHYVEFLHPGIIMSESSSEEVDHRDPTLIKLPQNSFGFRFYDREEKESEGELLVGKSKNHSYWSIQGEALTLADVKERFPKERTLIGNMERNKTKRVCKTEFGQFIPLDKEDTIIGA